MILKTTKKDDWWRKIQSLPWLHLLATGRPGYRKTTLFVHQLWCQHEIWVPSNQESNRDTIQRNLLDVYWKSSSKPNFQLSNEMYQFLPKSSHKLRSFFKGFTVVGAKCWVAGSERCRQFEMSSAKKRLIGWFLYAGNH